MRATATVTGAPALVRRLLPALAVVSLLGACTGTFLEGTPLVLLVANGGEDAPSQVVAFLVQPPGPATPWQVTPLAGADLAPDLTLPLRAWDWQDRDPLAAGADAARTRLVILATRQERSPEARTALLHRYDLSSFDVDAPALEPRDPAPLELVREGRWSEAAFPVAEGVQAPEDGVCLTDVAVSSEGRYVALLDRRAACQAGDPSVGLHVLDLEAPALVWSSTPDDVAPVQLVLDQQRQRLDVWTRTASGYAWRQLALDTLTLGPELQRLGTALVDVSAANDARWALVGGRLRVVSDDDDGEPGVASASGSDRRFVPTATRLPVVIVGADLVVHPSAASAALDPLARRYVDGATDVPDQLSYLLRRGAIDTLDLLVLGPDLPLREAVREAYRDPPGAPLLDAPRRLTAFRPLRLPSP